MDMSALRAFLAAHKWTVAGTALGFLCAILLLTIGFWRTLLLSVFVGCGFALGRVLDKQGAEALKSLFHRIFYKDNNA